MASVNILNNDIGAEQVQNFVAILKEHPTLKSLCGNNGDETELDMSGGKMGADGAIMLAPEIVANGAMTSLNISNNNIGQIVPPEGWTVTKKYGSFGDDGFNSPEGKWQAEAPPGSRAEGAIALADGIKNNGALVKLTMGNNSL